MLVFILRAIVIYQVLVFLFYGYIALVDPQGAFNFSKTLGVNLIQVLRDSILLPSSMLLKFFGYQIQVSEANIAILGTGGVDMNYGCLGFESWAALACLLFSYSDGTLLKNKLNYFIACVVLMQILNILRITLVAVASNVSITLANYHHDAYNLMIYGFIVFCFYYWIEKANGKTSRVRPI